jgi:hypothetical protein
MGCFISKVSLKGRHEEKLCIGGAHLCSPSITSLAMDTLPSDVKHSLERLPDKSFKNKYAPCNVLGTIAKSDKGWSLLCGPLGKQ